jgi:mono/diheme cytochrome c family protein
VNARLQWWIAHAVCIAAIVALRLLPTSAQDANSAKEFYVRRCQFCHGISGRATSPGRTAGTKDFDAPSIWNQPDSQWASAIEKGLKKMPPYGRSMNAQQIRDVVAYIRTIAKPKV